MSLVVIIQTYEEAWLEKNRWRDYLKGNKEQEAKIIYQMAETPIVNNCVVWGK